MIHRKPVRTTNIYQSSAKYHEKDDDFTEKIRNAEFYRVKKKTVDFSHVNGKVFDFDAWHRAHFHDGFGSSTHKRRSISWNKSSGEAHSSERTSTKRPPYSTGSLTQAPSSYGKQTKSNDFADKFFLGIIALIGLFTITLKCYEYFENRSIYNERRKRENNSNKND